MCYSEPEPAPLCRAAAASLAGPTASSDSVAAHDAAGFEGVEKRLELEFALSAGGGDDGARPCAGASACFAGRQFSGFTGSDALSRPQVCAP